MSAILFPEKFTTDPRISVRREKDIWTLQVHINFKEAVSQNCVQPFSVLNRIDYRAPG